MTNYVLVILSGTLMGICFNIPAIGFIGWFGLVPLFYVLFKERLKNRNFYLYMFIYGLVFYICYMFCLKSLYPLEWMGFSNRSSANIVILAIVGLSTLQALLLGFIGVFFNILRCKNNILNVFTLAFIWIIVEFIQGLGIMGFTGGQLAASQFTYLSFIQSSSLFGALFISFLIVIINGFMVCAINEQKYRKKYITIILLVFICNLCFGIYSIKTKEVQGNIKVAIIQGNVASAQKWEKGKSREIYDTYMRLSKEAMKENIKMLVWPETAIPLNVASDNRLYDSYEKLAKKLNGIFISGTIASAKYKEEDKDFNAIIVLGKEGYIAPVYLKRHLVPFGEFIPYRNILTKFIPTIGDIAGLGDLTPGKNANVIETYLGDIGNLICYESIFSNLAMESIKQGAELFVVATNESWFKDSSATTKHFAHSVLRAVEYNRFLVRAANTGISSIITPTGRQLGTIEAMKEGYLVGNISFLNTRTLYSYVGDVIVMIGITWLIGVGVVKIVKIYRHG